MTSIACACAPPSRLTRMRMHALIPDAQKFKEQFESAMESNKVAPTTEPATTAAPEEKPTAPPSDSSAPAADAPPGDEPAVAKEE